MHRVCARPGKPVNFVPAIDGDVRRWYKSDALWQSHDDRYDADQVLVIPGPEAVQGITRLDEPVGEMLGRFVAYGVAQLEAAGQRPRDALDALDDAAPHARRGGPRARPRGRRGDVFVATAPKSGRAPTGRVTRAPRR